MSASQRVEQQEWDQWEAERIERAAADRECTAWQNPKPDPGYLVARISDLEDSLYLKQAMLGSMAALVNEKARELRIARHRANRAEDVLQSVLDGMQPELAYATA